MWLLSDIMVLNRPLAIVENAKIVKVPALMHSAGTTRGRNRYKTCPDVL